MHIFLFFFHFRFVFFFNFFFPSALIAAILFIIYTYIYIYILVLFLMLHTIILLKIFEDIILFRYLISIYWTFDVSRTASYKITHVSGSVYLSVCPSVRLSPSFLKIESSVFSDIVHDDSCPWYLMTDGALVLCIIFPCNCIQ